MPNHRRLCLGLLGGLQLACTPDEEPPRQRQGEPLWVIVDESHSLVPKIVFPDLPVPGPSVSEIWAFDISDPGPPVSARRLVASERAGLVAATPWGGAVIQFLDDDGVHHELLRLDEAGDPERVSLLDPSNFWLEDVRFSADGRRMLADTHSEDNESELWAFEFDQREVVDARRLDSRGEGSQIQAFDFTPAGDAALWIATTMNERSPLMMAPLEPTVGPSMALTSAPVAGYLIFADKLLIFDYKEDDLHQGTQGTLLLPLADLQAQPVPGPAAPDVYFSSISADGRWLCYVVDDLLVVIAFDGLSFTEPKVVDTGSVSLGSWPLPLAGCEFPRTDTLIYLADYDSDSAMMMVDLSGPEPSPGLALTSSGEGRVGVYVLSPDQKALMYTVDQGTSQRLELVTFADPQPQTLLGSLSSNSVGDRFLFVDDRRILLRATTEGNEGDSGSEGGGLWLIELGPDSASATVTAFGDVGAGNWLDLQLALTPAHDQVLYQVHHYFAQPQETLWRMPLDGSAASTVISEITDRSLSEMAFLVP